MRTRRARGAWAVAALACAVALAGGCSGGGGAGNTGTTAPPPTTGLQITTPSLPNGIYDATYNETLQAADGKAPYTWSAITLPPGLSLSGAGVLSGAPQGLGYENCQVQVTDSSSPPQSTKKAFTLYVEQTLQLVAVPFLDPNVGQNYGAFIGTGGGSAPFTWTLVSGPQSLPPGLAFTASGAGATIGGVATTAGIFDFTVKVSEADPPFQTAQKNFSLTVTNIPVITTSTLPQGVMNEPYQATLQASGGTPPYTWSSGANQLPTGLSLDAATGVISGTPTETSSAFMNFTVTDSASSPQSDTMAIFLRINPPLSFTQTTLADAVLSRPYPATMPFQGGLGPYTVLVVSGALPDGISITGSGTDSVYFAGSPTTSGTFDFTLSVEDSESPPVTIQQAFSIKVNPLLVVQNTQPPSTIVGVPYSFQFQATGGVPPYQWSTSVPLPAGLTIDASTGLLSGTPTKAGTSSFNVVVSDSASPAQNVFLSVQNFNIFNQLKVATSSLPTVEANEPVKLQLGGFGGAGNYSWSMPSGGLPTGLTMDSTGMISGQTTATGNFTFTAEVNDPGPPAQTADQTLELTVGSPGRNDTPATATPLSDGTYAASISPIADPPNGTIAPDADYYKLTANPGAIVTVEITAARLTPPSPLDSVLEFVDSSGNRLSLCSSDPMNTSTGPFASGCMNDDITELNTTDSRLTLQVPSGDSGPLTFYAHVLDWRGDARPDMVYTITISGAN